MNFSFFTSNFPTRNIVIVKCYKLVFNAKNLSTNIGFWFILTLITIQLILFLIFAKRGMTKLRSSLYRYVKENPPQKSNSKNSLITVSTGINHLTTSQSLNHSNRKTQSSSKSQIEVIKNPRSTSTIELIPKKSTFYMSKEKVEEKMYQNTINTESNLIKIETKLKKDIDYDNIPFDSAVSMDHRGAFSMYWDVFKDNQSFFKVFSLKTNYDLISIKLTAFFFSLAVDFTLNSVFFSDDVISEKYKNNGKLSFLSEVLKS